jgi:hypothetical protein
METTPVARGRSGFEGESRRKEPDASQYTWLKKIREGAA